MEQRSTLIILFTLCCSAHTALQCMNKPMIISYESRDKKGNTHTKRVKLSHEIIQHVQDYQECKKTRDSVYQDADIYQNQRDVCKKVSFFMGSMVPVALANTLHCNKEDGGVTAVFFFMGSLGFFGKALDSHKRYTTAWEIAQKNTTLTPLLQSNKTKLAQYTPNDKEVPLSDIIDLKYQHLIESTRLQPFFKDSCCEPENNGSPKGQKIYNCVIAQIKKGTDINK